MARIRVKPPKDQSEFRQNWDSEFWNKSARQDRVVQSKEELFWSVYWSEVMKWDRQITVWGRYAKY